MKKVFILYILLLGLFSIQFTYANGNELLNDANDLYYQKNKKKQSLRLYELSIAEGNLLAKAQLAKMYYLGKGVKKDAALAHKWFKEVLPNLKIEVYKGNAFAQYLYAYYLDNGYGINTNIKEAVYWYREAANNGIPMAQSNLGSIYKRGEGVEKNYSKAKDWFTKSAIQGNYAGQYNLAYMYKLGEGTPKDYNKARFWFEKSAQNGYIGAEVEIANMYKNGKGVDQNLTKALELYEKVLYLRQKHVGEAHQDTASSYNSVGLLYKEMGEYEKALEFYTKASEIAQSVLGDANENTLRYYKNIGYAYKKLKAFDKALIFYNKVLHLRQKHLGEAHQDTAFSYNSVGLLYKEMGEYEKALEFYTKASEIAQSVLGEAHKNTLIYYKNLGSTYFVLGDPHTSEKFYSKVLAIKEKISPKDHRYIARLYNYLGATYRRSGEYKKSLTFHQKAITTLQKAVGKEYDVGMGTLYDSLASLYYVLRNYKKALEFYQKSIDILVKVYGEESSAVGGRYANMGLVYNDLGDSDKALEFLNKALKIDEKTHGDEHPKTGKNYKNIGTVYKRLGDYRKALDFYNKALKIEEKTYQKGNMNLVGSYVNIGNLYNAKKMHRKALEFFQKALDAAPAKKNHRFIANCYGSRGSTYRALGQYSKALENSLKALQIREKLFNDTHFSIGTSYHNISAAHQNLGHYYQAYDYAKQSYSIFLFNRDNNFQILDTKQKTFYLKMYDGKVPMLLRTAHLYREHNATKEQEVEVVQETFNSWLNYKGSIFDSENAIATLYANTKDPALKAKIDDLVNSKRDLAKLYQSLPKPKEREQWQKNIKVTEDIINTLTSQIAEKAESFKEQQGLKSIHYSDISNNLKEDELYVDYAKAGEHYYLFSLDDKADITFTQIDANTTKEIDILVKSFREDVGTILKDANISDEKLTALTADSKEKLSRLYDIALHQPLGKELLGRSNLILSPDGALRLLPFEAMYDKANSRYLIEEKEIRYIPSGKELVRLYKYGTKAITQEPAREIIIISNPNYNAKDVLKVASNDTDEVIPLTPNTNRAGIIKSLFRMRFAPLPGTKVEAASIKETLKGQSLTEYKEKDASEANLMQVKKPKVLHIATHGFFVNDKTIPNPMLKSGIALSGANISAVRGKSDGIVTALKLSGMKLKGTDLVVLSACETGVVDLDSTESVSGLSKAFIQAGAQNVVTSLWAVNDEATTDLMSSFYQQMKGNTEYSKAMKEAKLKMIKYEMHPFYWAPFVMSGI